MVVGDPHPGWSGNDAGRVVLSLSFLTEPAQLRRALTLKVVTTMTDFSDTYGTSGYYDGSYSTAVDTAVSAGTTTDYGSSFDYSQDSYAASSASWDAWGASLEADSYSNQAYYAGDYEASQAWSQVSDQYQADSNEAYSASGTAWDASYDAYADESAAWAADSSYDAWQYDSTSTYDYSSSYAATSTYDSGSYDYSSSYSSTDVVTDYYTSADW